MYPLAPITRMFIPTLYGTVSRYPSNSACSLGMTSMAMRAN